ncbi:spindle pole body component 110-like [Dorcoceras hygrometricum]|uniref:Spindle pole body component 110-like n=1 Tax=Dorcoceras hygrometricum TaxID=472368 RepID=A0A2Z7CZ44_9LAMI|nr:spindle pole body component 110-like [Dorcoceras hygrometricum]
MRIRPPELETSIYDAKYHVSLPPKPKSRPPPLHNLTHAAGRRPPPPIAAAHRRAIGLVPISFSSLQIELSKLKTENESLRLRSCELESENERLNLVMSSWTQSSVSLSKLHEAQKPLNDKSGLGFNGGESSSGETRIQSNLEQYATLSANLAELMAFITRGRDDKKGEVGSSHGRGQPPPEDRSKPGSGDGGSSGSRSEPSRKRGSSGSIQRDWRYWISGSG